MAFPWSANTLYVAPVGEDVDGRSGGPSPEGAVRLLRSSPRRHLLILGLLCALYFVVSFVLSYLRLIEFTATNWDLGIFQQSLWTTTHGYVFFEVGDWETWTTVSFLQIHPAFILYLLVPVYAAAPSPLTLLAVQSGAVAAAAIPLYLVGRAVLGDSRRSLVIAGLYLAYAPVLTSNLYDFHLESFLPFELFLLFFLWWQGRFVWGSVVALATYVTLEVTPFLVAALALYFLLRPVEPQGAQSRAWLRRFAVQARLRLTSTAGRWSLGLLVASGVAYLVLRTVEWWVLPALLGVAPQPPAGTSPIVGPASTSGLGLTWALTAHLTVKLGFWGLLLGLLAFLPLFSPRALILALPWFGFTLQSDHLAWVQLGYQYGFLAAIPLVLAAVLGLRRFEATVLPRLKGWMARRPRLGPMARPRSARPRIVLTVAVLAVLVLANVYLTPVNPRMQNLNSALSGYRLSYTVHPGYSSVAQAAALIPPNALVLASDNLFPFVANDAQAYSLLWIPQQPNYLPFDAAHLPKFVFLSSKEQFAEPSWLFIATSNRTLYGALALVSNTPVGTVHLWELGYSGPVQLLITLPPGSPEN